MNTIHPFKEPLESFEIERWTVDKKFVDDRLHITLGRYTKIAVFNKNSNNILYSFDSFTEGREKAFRKALSLAHSLSDKLGIPLYGLNES